MDLDGFFREHPHVVLAFSGGVDSCWLLHEAMRCGADVRPIMLVTPFQPSWETEIAVAMAARLGAALHSVHHDMLSDERICRNDAQRCYVCKLTMFRQLQKIAHSEGYSVIIDGTNASDDASDRPGMRALQACGILSPLRLCGLGKSAIRQSSRRAGLPTWNRPAYSCLATRIPVGTAITADKLAAVEAAEGCLMDLGFSDFRVRWQNGTARLEVTEAQMPLVLERKVEIRDALEPFFNGVQLDLVPRRADPSVLSS